MSVYKGNLKVLRKLVGRRKAAIERSIIKAEERIKQGKNGAKGTLAQKNLAANKAALKDAKKCLTGLKRAELGIKAACCQNDLNCEIEVL